MSELISVVINADTRPGFTEKRAFCGMNGGAALTGAGGGRSIDFLTSNVRNKINFFRGYPIEVTLYIDMHLPLPDEVRNELFDMYNMGMIQNLVFNKNNRIYNGEHIRQWQDINYLNALILARGKYVAHFDADTSAFRKSDCYIVDRMVEWVNSGTYDFVSYPTIHSPNEGDIPGQNALPSPDGGFDYLWTSTRFFFCKREAINYNRFIDLLDDRYWIASHKGRPHRYPNVTEQILGFLAGPGKVLYPPKELESFMIFCWHDYYSGTLDVLNEEPYEGVYDYIINKCGGIGGACDVCQKEPI